MTYLSLFSCVRNTVFLQQCSIEGNVPSTVSLLRQPLMLEARGSSMLLCGENWVNFKRNTAYISGFSVARNIIFLQNGPLLVNGGSTVSLVIRLSMLCNDTIYVILCAWPCIMYHWECWVIFWMEYCSPLRNYQYGQTHVSYEQYKLC
jgi:hypothetical protein